MQNGQSEIFKIDKGGIDDRDAVVVLLYGGNVPTAEPRGSADMPMRDRQKQ